MNFSRIFNIKSQLHIYILWWSMAYIAHDATSICGWFFASSTMF